MTVVVFLVCASTLYACVFAVFSFFAHCAFGDHFRREEDITIQEKVADNIVSKNSISTDDEYESDDEEDGYVSSSSQFSGEDCSSFLEDDHSLSGSSTAEDSETELSETELYDTHQHTESDEHQDNISSPIEDDMGIVTSVQS